MNNLINNCVFRAVNPRNDEDIRKYFELLNDLCNFLNSKKTYNENRIKWKRYHFGAPEYVFPELYNDKSTLI